MTDETGASTGGEADAADLPADAPESFSSPREAADYFASLVDKRKEPAAESADPATAANESPVEGDAARPEKDATGETEEADPAEKPPLDLPRSWTKDRTEHWNKLDPETQEFLLEQDRKASAEVRRVQNEAAEKLKGLTAKEQEAEQARQGYEARQTEYTKALETALQADFGDIQNLADVRKMQAEDPFRFQAWQVRQMELSTAQAEKQKIDQGKADAKQTEVRERKILEHSLLIEKAPEYADKAKLDAAQKAASELFREKGFTDDQLANIIDENPVLDDHRMQLIVDDARKYRDLMKAKAAVSAKPLPPVQRPGTSRPSGQGVDSERIQTLNRKPELTVREATELYTLQQQASQRRAS